jgi:hypothetical protein
MAYKYKNVINLQGPEETIQEALWQIHHPDYGPGTIDFNAITPMPTWVSVNGDAARESWSRENWGVPENAGGLAESLDSYDGGETIEFDTMGGDVRELMRKLSMMFPGTGLVVDYLWASEDVGKDSGMAQFAEGKQIYEYIPEPGSSAAYEAAFDIFATSANDHGLVFDAALGTYRYGGKLFTKTEAFDERKEE